MYFKMNVPILKMKLKTKPLQHNYSRVRDRQDVDFLGGFFQKKLISCIMFTSGLSAYKFHALFYKIKRQEPSPMYDPHVREVPVREDTSTGSSAL